jgi:hypothetical protein
MRVWYVFWYANTESSSKSLTYKKELAEREGFEPSKGFWPLHP